MQELVRSPDGGGVIDEVLERSLGRFDDDTRALLGAAAVAGSGTPLAVLAIAVQGDLPAAVRHARAAVALTRSLPSSPLLVHCLDHLADAVDRAGEDNGEDPDALRVEADTLAAAAGVVRPGRERSSPRGTRYAPRPASIRRDDWQWVLTSPLGEARLPDSVRPIHGSDEAIVNGG